MLEAQSFWELVQKRADATPDATMTIDESGRSMTFGEFRARAESSAAGLAAMGVRTGDVVSWQLPTWLESMVLVGALSRLGVVQNPILPIYREREVGFVVRQARSMLLIVPTEFRGFDYQAMARAIGGVQVLVCDRSLPAGDAGGLPPIAPDGDAIRWLFYTSGTTADPKGARHTDSTVMAPAIGMADRLRLVPEDRNALVFPFTHIGGIIWMLAGLLVGFTNVLDEAFNPATTIDVLRREGVTIAGAGTPFHMAYLKAQRDNPGEALFPNVRVFPGGGAPKPPQLHYDVRKELGGAGIASGYGLTEAPILTMACIDDDDETLANTEGRALPGVDLRVVDGEIRAKAPQLMKGYLDSSLDAEAFDENGYFRTGDLGRLDEAGNVTITGRLKDIIIRKGENISAKEVEDLLFQHPDVSDVAVIGLPDPELGERCCAVVVGSIGFEEMAGFLKWKGLRTQAVPERLEIVDALPRNPTGKVLKFELQDRFAGGARV